MSHCYSCNVACPERGNLQCIVSGMFGSFHSGQTNKKKTQIAAMISRLIDKKNHFANQFFTSANFQAKTTNICLFQLLFFAFLCRLNWKWKRSFIFFPHILKLLLLHSFHRRVADSSCKKQRPLHCSDHRRDHVRHRRSARLSTTTKRCPNTCSNYFLNTYSSSANHMTATKWI